MRPAVFFDRDDTLIDTRWGTQHAPRPGDLADPHSVRLMPGALETCRRLVQAGFVLIAVSNQGCVARATATVQDVHNVNQRVFSLLPGATRTRAPNTEGYVTLPENPSLVSAIYFCPFHPDGVVAEFAREHDWRKPAAGMIHRAAQDFDLDIARSWLIGDAPRDRDSGVAAGIDAARVILVAKGGMTLADACARILADA